MKKNAPKSKSSALANNLLASELMYDEHLMLRYSSPEKILQHLREVPADAKVYEMLGELFFEYLYQNSKTGTLSEEELKMLRDLRDDVMHLYELVRASQLVDYKLGRTNGNTQT
jgi:hypothetical protein